MKKPNLQSPLDRLDDAKQHEVFELLKGVKYEDALPRLKSEFGVKTSAAALSRFLKRRAVVEQLRTSVYVAEAFEQEQDVKALDRKSRAAVTAALWNAISNGDADSIVAFGKLALGFAADDRAAKELALARDKFEFDAAKKAMEFAAEIKGIAADDALDDDEKIQKVREALFG